MNSDGQRPERVYLGDGVYARFDGWHVVLTVENGVTTTETIYLEPAVYAALVGFAKRCGFQTGTPS